MSAKRVLVAAGVWLAGVVSTVLAGVIIFRTTSTAVPDLEATVSAGAVHYPPPIREELSAFRAELADEARSLQSALLGLRSRVSSVSWCAALDRSHGPADKRCGDCAAASAKLAEAALQEVTSATDLARWTTPAALPDKYGWLTRTGWPEGYWSATVRNVGDGTAKGVSLDLPGAVEVVVTRPGRQYFDTAVGGVVDLGELAPAQTATVLAWASSAPSEYHFQSVVLRHGGGVADVRFEVSMDRRWQSARDGLYRGLLILAMSVLMTVFVVAVSPVVRGLHALRGATKQAESSGRRGDASVGASGTVSRATSETSPDSPVDHGP